MSDTLYFDDIARELLPVKADRMSTVVDNFGRPVTIAYRQDATAPNGYRIAYAFAGTQYPGSEGER